MHRKETRDASLCWIGVNELSVETVDDPGLVNPHDVIVAVRLTTTCGSDLHFLGGYLPGMREGDVIGHEFMGEIVDTGPEVTNVRVGDRVVVPSFIGCGKCPYCADGLHAVCDTTNPNAAMQQPVLGYPTGGIYGYTHPFGGYQGSHAEYIRVPSATSTASRSPTVSATNRPCSCRTRYRRATWAPTSATSPRATPWRSGAPAPSVSWPRQARRSWAPTG